MEDKVMENIGAANCLLKLVVFPALFHKMVPDENRPVFEIVGNDVDRPINSTLFPMITRVVKTGSRAEQLFLESSDVDYIYEIGPVKVKSEIDQASPKDFQFKYLKTANCGFYYVDDQGGEALYSTVLQTKLAPMVRGALKDIASLPETKAALPVEKQRIKTLLEKESRKIERSPEDVVIALKLDSWPDDVWKEFSTKHEKIWNQVNFQTLKDIDLYLVPKSHPESKNRWAEWRLSFSMVEIELMKELPFVHRKAYLCCKQLIKYMKMDNFQSYVLKTVLLWSMDECNEEAVNVDEESLYKLVLALICKLMKGYEDEVVQHYFLPDVNLLEKVPHCNSIYNKLKDCQKDKKFVGILLSSLKSFGIYEFIPVFESNKPSCQVLFSKFRNLEICDTIIRSAIIVRRCYFLLMKELFIGLRDPHFNKEADEYVFNLLQFLYQIKVFSNRSGLRFSNMRLDDIWDLCQSLIKFVKSLKGKLPISLYPYSNTNAYGPLNQNPYCQDPSTEDPRLKVAYDGNKIEQHFDQKKKIVEDAMKNEWWEDDQIFSSLVLWINQEALKIPEDISLELRNIMCPEERQIQIEMFNFGLTDEMFGITTPGKYLLFLTQHIFNNLHIYNMANSEETFWAFYLPGNRNALETYKRTSKISIVFTNSGNYEYIPRE